MYALNVLFRLAMPIYVCAGMAKAVAMACGQKELLTSESREEEPLMASCSLNLLPPACACCTRRNVEKRMEGTWVSISHSSVTVEVLFQIL